MLYTIFTSIVFIAEIVIAITILQILHRLDVAINNIKETVDVINPEVEEVCNLGKKISYQIVEISQDFVDKVKSNSEDSAAKYLSKILIGIMFFKINSKLMKKFKHSKLKRLISKGLRTLEFVI